MSRKTSNKERFSLSEYEETIRIVLDSGGEFTIFPHGTSMLPLIKEGRDSVTLVKSGKYRVGDIAFYRRAGGEFILHRIIAEGKEENGTFTMCGDNQLLPETGIKPEQIIAKAGYLTRKGRKITPDNPLYRLYTLLWRSFFIRRVFFKLRRIIHGN